MAAYGKRERWVEGDFGINGVTGRHTFLGVVGAGAVDVLLST